MLALRNGATPSTHSEELWRRGVVKFVRQSLLIREQQLLDHRMAKRERAKRVSDRPVETGRALSSSLKPTEMSPFERTALWLSQNSIIAATVGRMVPWLRTVEASVAFLTASPLGMFFYNQRAILFGLGGLYIALLLVLAQVRQAPGLRTAAVIIAVFWLMTAILTLALHGLFAKRLRAHLTTDRSVDFPPVFYPYFILDSIVVLGVVGVGLWQHLDLRYFLFLLLANTIVYYVCEGSYHVRRKRRFPTPLVLWLSSLALFVWPINISGSVLLRLGPLVGTTAISTMAVLIVSFIRQRDHAITQKQLELLGHAEEILSGLGSDASQREKPASHSRHPMEEFDSRMRRLLRTLVRDEDAFWYSAGRLWHIEYRGATEALLVPGPYVGMSDGQHDSNAQSAPSWLLTLREPTFAPADDETALVPFTNDWRGANTLPGRPYAAIVPIVREGQISAVLVLYGSAAVIPPTRLESSFLKSLASIIADTLEQWETRVRTFSEEELDELFRCSTLDEVYARVARVLRRYIPAKSCLVHAKSPQGILQVVATDGLDVAVGLNIRRSEALLAATKRPQRYHPGDAATDSQARALFISYREATSNELDSWMAVPIGSVGVLEFRGSDGRIRWFTPRDQNLAVRLARRLHQVIEQLTSIKNNEDSLAKARSSEAQALTARRDAESTAKQRQDDIMIITHQLQAPLVSMRASVSNLKRRLTHPDLVDKLDHIHSLVTDSLALCYGTVTTFAQEAGRKTSFGKVAIDAPLELERLARRTQRTNAREDLEFEFNTVPTFPTIMMDRNVFTSVFYSLVHNAMKYAAPDSRVTLECSFEHQTELPAMKVKSIGEPIRYEERDLIFEKYGRGEMVRTTGRHHAGVGLGLWVARQLMRAVGGDLTVELAEATPSLSIFIVHCPTKQ